MRRKSSLVAALSVAGLVVGCSNVLHGTWRSQSVSPPEMSKHFNLARATFNDDKTFTATATYGGKTRQDSGTWSYNGFKLKLTTKEGKDLEYDAMYNSFTSRLSVSKMEEGKKVTVVMVKDESGE